MLLPAVDPNTTISDLCTNITTDITENVSKTKCEDFNPLWYFLAIFVLFCLSGISLDVSRAYLIKELRDTPSYELHQKLEKLYKQEVAAKPRCQHGRRYLEVSYEDDRDTMRRTITIVEDLSWNALPDIDACRQERASAQFDNDHTSITSTEDNSIQTSTLSQHQNYIPVTEESGSEHPAMSEMPSPPPYLPATQSVHDSDSDMYEPAHP